MTNKRKILLHINPKNITVSKDFNSRREFGDIEELAKQIAKDGVLNPIHVRCDEYDPMKYILVDGERRYRAIMHNINNGINIDTVPALLVDNIDVKELYRIQIQSNEGKNFNEYEYGVAYQHLQEEGMSNTEIAELLNKKIWHINVCLAHLKRDERVQELIRTDRLTGADTRRIYQAHKGNEQEAVNVILKLKEYTDGQGEHKISLTYLDIIQKQEKEEAEKKQKEISIDKLFSKTRVSMDTLRIKNGLYCLYEYIKLLPEDSKRKYSVSYIYEHLKNGELIDQVLELNKYTAKAE